jgi:hypothetical protein
MKHIEYPHMDENIVCTSDAFQTLEIAEFEESEAVLLLKYTSCNPESCASNQLVTISCTNWRNPNLAVLVPGFSITTFDQREDQALDFSSSFTLDATGLQF